MESLFDTKGKRAVGWGVVLLLAGWWLLGIWNSGPDYEDLEPSPHELRELAALADDGYSDWLTTFYDSQSLDGSSLQMLIVQGVPDEPPLVLATIKGSSDDEGATHWRCPWPSVTKALSGAMSEPAIVSGSYADVDYLHHIIPFDKSGTRCLLINQMKSQPPIFDIRAAAAVLSALLVVALFVSRSE